MIPQLLLLLYLGIGIRTAHRQRTTKPIEFTATLLQAVILIGLLVWGNFFDILIQRIQ